MNPKKILLLPFEGIEKDILMKISAYLEKTFGKKVITGETTSQGKLKR
ncbi:MAG: hypothetical protein HZA09_07485 [Nitrospirae bacterium]|nr:hypothetical protein [Nitrospirota bacterium]